MKEVLTGAVEALPSRPAELAGGGSGCRERGPHAYRAWSVGRNRRLGQSVCARSPKRGHDVVAIMTHSATRFVGPITFEAITRHKVITDQWDPGAIPISSTSRSPQRSIVAARCACDRQYHRQVRERDCRRLPHDAYYWPHARRCAHGAGHEHQMFSHEAVRANLDTLASRGVRFVEPGEGYLACGWIGKGRLAEPDEICAAADLVLRPATSLSGKRIVVTAGPTFEDIDPVRYIGNRSSGRMGFAIAAEAARRGASVTLIAGPTTAAEPSVSELIRVRSAEEMHRAVMAQASGADAGIMAAAVADYMPEARAGQKVAKTDGSMQLVLRRTPDILKTLGERRESSGGPAVLVGFCGRNRECRREGRAEIQEQAGRPHRRQRRVARGRRLRRRHERSHAGIGRRHRARAPAIEGSRRPGHPRPSRASARFASALPAKP